MIIRSRWIGKNIDLALLTRRIEDFFKRNDFETKRDESKESYKILAMPRHAHIYENAEVKISGDPNDFVIEFSAGKKARSSMMLGLLTSIIGGGSIFLKNIKTLETLEKLEKEFWICVEDLVTQLVDSTEANVGLYE